MICIFEEKGNDIQCKCCGVVLKNIKGSPKRTCKQACGEYPSIPQMVANFTSSMVNFVIDGFKTVDKEEQERRLNICRSCPFYDELQNRCKACGCSSSLSSRIASYDCPKGYWENEKGK